MGIKNDKSSTIKGEHHVVKTVNVAVANQMASVVELPTFLKKGGRLTLTGRKTIVKQALTVLELVYVHLPFKRAMHAVEPIQKLKLLLYHLENMTKDQMSDELDFHNEMTQIFNSLRDLHTNYLLPSPYNNKTAFLPFYVEEYYEAQKPKYIVSKMMDGFEHETFKAGVEILYWNGVPINRAVQLNGQRQAGSNEEARRALGVDALTVRPMIRVLPPDEEWVQVGYLSLDGDFLEIKIRWLVFSGSEGDAPFKTESAGMASLGFDLQTDAVQEAKKVLFAPGALAAARRVAETGEKQASAEGEIETTMPTVFRVRPVENNTYGYIRIYTFMVDDADLFVQEFVRLVALLPQKGLIIDVRGNGGGLIYAGEQLLQVLTPHPIEPETFQFNNTALTCQLCQMHSPSRQLKDFDLSDWLPSTRMAVETGATYSQGFPISDPKACNNVGQKYYGPVVLITDALCYSTTDIFAAGFQDHQIGKILATAGNTGAGGANVWEHELLMKLFNTKSSPFESLPGGASLRAAIRRSLRVGKNAGMPVEDLGVIPDYRHYMTKDDLLKGNVDLIKKAAEIVAAMPVYSLAAVIKDKSETLLTLEITTNSISRLDLFLDARPQKSIDVQATVTLVAVDVSLMKANLLEIKGFQNNQLVATVKIKLNE